jgi:spore germination cell wall hydrolase CwlJ-like protein
MVRNLHHEARGENSKGMVAVANVVMNRANHPNFPQTVCGVIYERFQFSWVGNVKPVAVSRADDTAKLIAYEAVVNKSLKDNTGGALFFHATYSRFSWNTSKVIVTRKVGDHIFYKYRGTNGKTKAKRRI